MTIESAWYNTWSWDRRFSFQLRLEQRVKNKASLATTNNDAHEHEWGSIVFSLSCFFLFTSSEWCWLVQPDSRQMKNNQRRVWSLWAPEKHITLRAIELKEICRLVRLPSSFPADVPNENRWKRKMNDLYVTVVGCSLVWPVKDQENVWTLQHRTLRMKLFFPPFLLFLSRTPKSTGPKWNGKRWKWCGHAFPFNETAVCWCARVFECDAIAEIDDR